MCGGGGHGNRGGRSGSSSASQLRSIADQNRFKQKYESEINEYFKMNLKDYNDRDIESIKTHLDEIENVLKDELDIIGLLYGGSISKYTYINGFSDVDVLAILKNEIYHEKTPEEVLNIFKERLQQRYPRSEIKTGDLAVTIKFSDGHVVQVLPAVRTKTGIRISDPDTKDWSAIIQPDRFARKLTEVNQQNGGRVVPVIKLFKAINVKLPKEKQLSGYHIESLAIEAFRDYKGKLNYKDMLMHFVNKSRTNVQSPIVDSSGQSRHVDDYLGGFWHKERLVRQKVLDTVYNKMQKAETSNSANEWKDLMDNGV